MATIFFNTLGVIGAVLLLFGFYRITSGRWNNKSFWYELDNLVGAFLLVVYQIYYHAFVTVVVNAIWGTVALWGVFVFVKRLHSHRRKRPRKNKK